MKHGEGYDAGEVVGPGLVFEDEGVLRDEVIVGEHGGFGEAGGAG